MRAGTAPPKSAGHRPAPGEPRAFARADGERSAPDAPAPHFVLKRGHHGRYRFSLRNEFGGISGEVFVRTDAGAGPDREEQVFQAIARLARSLLAVTEPSSLA